MARIGMTTRQLHELLKPVIPHAYTDSELRNLSVIRIEAAQWAIYAVATDRYTLAAERHELPGDRIWNLPAPVHVKLADAKACLGLFRYSKDDDPALQITIDTVPVPIQVAGRPDVIRRLAVTIESEDGTRLVMHDQRDPASDPLASWRDMLAAALTRDQATAAPAFNLNATELARWAAACRKGERLAVCPGRKGADLVLIAVEDHFLGVWKPQSLLESPAEMLEASVWAAELTRDAPGPGLRTATGLATDVPDWERECLKDEARREQAAATGFQQPGQPDGNQNNDTTPGGTT